MVVFETRSIKKNLSVIASEYDATRNSVVAALFSKQAVMEVGGWVEQTVDNILYYYIDKTIGDVELRKVLKEEVVDKVYGFKYSSEFKPLFQKIIGAGRYQQIVKSLEKTGLDQVLYSKLNTLCISRNRAAHTYWRKVTLQFDAPSTTALLFEDISKILRKIWECVRRIAQNG